MDNGEVTERPNVAVSKTVGRVMRPVGSNPTLSAIFLCGPSNTIMTMERCWSLAEQARLEIV